MATLKEKKNIDSILTYMFLKKLVTPITKTKAYKMGLVDNVGKIKNKPETEEEETALTILDKFIFKIKRLLGSKLSQLNNFLFLTTLNNSFYNKLVVRGTIQQRAEIKRIQKDIEKLQEKYKISFEELQTLLINEKLRIFNKDF